MAWWYNTESGQLTSAGSVQNFFQSVQGDIGLGSGWHKLKVADNATGVQAAADARKEFPQGAAPDYGPVTPAKVVKVAAGEAANAAGIGGGNPLTGLASIGDFFGRLSQGATWIRVAEGLLGIVLIAIGLARITHAVPIATKIAGAVA